VRKLMFVLLAIVEVIVLALVVFGDVWLFRLAITERRLVYVPAIVLLTLLVAALGLALMITLAFQQCTAQEGGCFS
jgi:hypothetical protein